MKVLVTGASGFVGSNLIEYLYQKTDISVVGMVRSIQDIPANSNIEYRKAEICSKGQIDIDISDIDVVIHAAGRAHVMNEKLSSPIDEYRRVNTKGTISLAKLSVKSGVKQFIFLSTIKVNGDNNINAKPFLATDAPRPNDPYSISKFEAELGLKEISSNTELSYTIIRPTVIYGQGVKGNIGILLKLIKSNIPIPFKGLNKNKRSMIGIENLVDLIYKCINSPSAVNKLFLASDDDDISTARLVNLIGKSIDRNPILFYVPENILAFFANLLGFSDSYNRVSSSLRVNIEDTCKNLDWKPPHTIEYGFKKLGEE